MSERGKLKAKSKNGVRHKVIDWLWRPLCAKIWWMFVPAYWSGMIASLRVEWLASFYHSAIGGFANLFFFPPMIALVLCFRYLKARFDLAGIENSVQNVGWTGDEHSLPDSPKQFDQDDSRSGVYWVGNPLNPRHPNNINRVS